MIILNDQIILLVLVFFVFQARLFNETVAGVSGLQQKLNSLLEKAAKLQCKLTTITENVDAVNEHFAQTQMTETNIPL